MAGQETAQRNEAIRTAFGLMLVKVTGNRGVAGRPELAEAIRRAPRYVQQYQYRLAPMDAEVLVTARHCGCCRDYVVGITH